MNPERTNNTNRWGQIGLTLIVTAMLTLMGVNFSQVTRLENALRGEIGVLRERQQERADRLSFLEGELRARLGAIERLLMTQD